MESCGAAPAISRAGCCLLQQSSLLSAVRSVERVRVAVAAAVFRLDEALQRVTISAGVAVTSGEYLAALMKATDLGLCRAKENGRNRVDPPLLSVRLPEQAVVGCMRKARLRCAGLSWFR